MTVKCQYIMLLFHANHAQLQDLCVVTMETNVNPIHLKVSNSVPLSAFGTYCLTVLCLPHTSI